MFAVSRPLARLFAAGALTIGAACRGDKSADSPASSTSRPATDVAEPTPVDAGGVYENTINGFRFRHTLDWAEIDEPLGVEHEVGQSAGVTRVAIGDLRGDGSLVGVYIEVRKLPQDVDEDDVDDALAEVNELISQAAGASGGVVESEQSREVASHEGRAYVVTFPLGGVRTTSEFVVTFEGDKQFNVVCQAPATEFDAIRPHCETVWDTFEFIP